MKRSVFFLLVSVASPVAMASPHDFTPAPAAARKAVVKDPLLLPEFSPAVKLTELRPVRALIRKYQAFLTLLADKDGEKKVFAQSTHGVWPLYLEEND